MPPQIHVNASPQDEAGVSDLFWPARRVPPFPEEYIFRLGRYSERKLQVYSRTMHRRILEI